MINEINIKTAKRIGKVKDTKNKPYESAAALLKVLPGDAYGKKVIAVEIDPHHNPVSFAVYVLNGQGVEQVKVKVQEPVLKKHLVPAVESICQLASENIDAEKIHLRAEQANTHVYRAGTKKALEYITG